MVAMPDARNAATSSSSFTVPRWYGSTSVICEPKCMARPRSANSERAAQLAYRNDVGASAEGLEHLEHADIAVCLHGIADAVRHVLQGVVQRVVLRPHEIRAVDVGRRAHALRDAAQQRGVEA